MAYKHENTVQMEIYKKKMIFKIEIPKTKIAENSKFRIF